MSAPSLSTHVLDTRLGRPAAGLAVRLERVDRDTVVGVAEGRTDAEGRIRELAAGLAPGDYRLVFEIGAYFASQGAPGLFSRVTFDLAMSAGHYHVPLLVSPYACVSYRGA